MSTTYHYVVLRLAPDDLRGEIINVGVMLLHDAQAPKIVMMATLNKLRAIDASWDMLRLLAWTENIHTIVQHCKTASVQVQVLGSFGFCDPDAVGTFHAETDTELANAISELRRTYVANRATAEKPKREKHTRLQTAMREQFKRMQVLGDTVDDIAAHLVVANVPVAGYPDLKADFVYKNGTYRITQTIDYHVALDSLHNKLMEACVKSTAAGLAVKGYGADTKRLAVLDIPQEFADSTDGHVDLLIAQGFEVFHFSDTQSMGQYFARAVPQQGQMH
jgi:hypothetical protein